MIPTTKAIATDTKIAIIIVNALLVFIISPIFISGCPEVFINAIATVPPISAKTMETVVEVGSPRVLKISRRTILDAMTAKNMNITSSKENIEGWKTPFLATSIMPLLIDAPKKMPIAATMMIVLKVATLAPIAD